MFVSVSISICRVTDLSRLTVTVSLTSTSVSSAPTMTTDWMCGGTVVVVNTAILAVFPTTIEAVVMCRNITHSIEPRTILVIVVTAIIVDTLMFVSVSISICCVTDLSRLTVTVSLTSTSVSSALTMTTDWMCGGTVVVVYTAILAVFPTTIEAVVMCRNMTHSIEPRTILVIMFTTIIVDTLMFVPVSISICGVTDLSRLTVTVSLTSTSVSSALTMTTDWMCEGTVVVIDTAV